MANFLDYSARLRQYVPTLSPEQSELFVGWAWREIRRASDRWHFNYRQERWFSPALVTMPGVNLVQFSSIVGLTHDNLEQVGQMNNPPVTQRQFQVTNVYSIIATDVIYLPGDLSILSGSATVNSSSGAFGPEHVGLKIRVKGAGSAGGDFDAVITVWLNPVQVTVTGLASTTVIAVDGYVGSSLTLDNAYSEASNPNGTANVRKSLFSPINTAFERLDYVADPVSGYMFGWQILSLDELDQIDARRSSVGNPFRVYFHGFGMDTGLPIYEFWPAPTAARAYTIQYWSMGFDFTQDTDTVPFPITEELLLLGSRIQAYEWGSTQDPDPRRRADYARALQFAKLQYSSDGLPGRPLGLLDEAIRKNDGIIPDVVSRQRGRRTGWPIDSNWAQAHSIPPGWGL